MTETYQSQFVYVIFIRTTPEALWDALTNPERMRDYWFGMHQESDWKPGSPWKMVFQDGRVADSGRILEAAPPNHLAIEWRNGFREELRAEGFSRCTYDLEPRIGGVVKLTITHQSAAPNSKVIEAVSGGWPSVLSSLKSLLETGEAMERP